jgi:hypothetical protein
MAERATSRREARGGWRAERLLRRIDRVVARVDRRDDYGQLLASRAVVYAVDEVDDVEAWRAEIRRQARADRIKVRTGFSQASCGRNKGVRHATDYNQKPL